jgi:hypothetical protein
MDAEKQKYDLRTARQKPGFFVNIDRLNPRFSVETGFLCVSRNK